MTTVLDDYLTREEAAEALGVSLPTFDRYQRSKNLTVYRKIGTRRNFYNPQEISNLLGYHPVPDKS